MDNVVTSFQQKQSTKRSNAKQQAWIGTSLIYEEAVVRMGNDENRLATAVRRGAVKKYMQGATRGELIVDLDWSDGEKLTL